MELKFRTLTKDDVEVRIGTTKKDEKGVLKGYSLLLYKNARVDMAILDESVGPANWQRKHTCLKENIYCSVGIKNGDEWIWKEDCGVCAGGEEVIVDKGEASDSLKRACFNWGIGRELYTAPFIWINSNDKNARYEVSDMVVSEDHKITKLIIVDAKTKNIVFTFGVKAGATTNTPKTTTTGETTTDTDAPKKDNLLDAYLIKMQAAKTNKEVNALWSSLSPEQQAMTEYKEPCVNKCKQLKAA